MRKLIGKSLKLRLIKLRPHNSILRKTVSFGMIFIVFCVVFGCKESSSTAHFNKENFTEHYVDYAKGTLLLPHKYEMLTKEKLPYFISEADSTNVLQRLIHNLEADRRDYLLFSNENDKNDIILIHKSEFTNFSKQDANRYLGMLESNMKNMYGIGNYERLQKKMSQIERSKYMKFKYRVSRDGVNFYQTQYIVTSAATTYGVVEMRMDIIDHEDLIKRINYLVN